jgi:hypothetical protein
MEMCEEILTCPAEMEQKMQHKERNEWADGK